MPSATTQTTARQIETTGIYEDVADLDHRLRKVESALDILSEKRRAHLRAKTQDARDTLDRGDTKDLVVITPAEANNGTHDYTCFVPLYRNGIHKLKRVCEVLTYSS